MARVVKTGFWRALLLQWMIFAGGCDDNEGPKVLDTNCNLEQLPLSGEAGAPTLTVAVLECQGAYINLLATAVDPQGDADLQNIQQTIGVFLEPDCKSLPKELVDNLVGSGVEESFGIVFEESTDPDIFAAICASTHWPIEAHLTDAPGHVTVGRVLATVIH